MVTNKVRDVLLNYYQSYIRYRYRLLCFCENARFFVVLFLNQNLLMGFSVLLKECVWFLKPKSNKSFIAL